MADHSSLLKASYLQCCPKGNLTDSASTPHQKVIANISTTELRTRLTVLAILAIASSATSAR